jgi:hypothetical protein
MLPDIPEQYLLPVERTDYSEILVEWQPLLPADTTPWLLTRFGEVFFAERQGNIGMLQVSTFRYQVVAKNSTDFREWLLDPDKLAEWFLAPLVDRLVASGRLLGTQQCYSFIQPLGLGGALSERNVMTISIREHFLCWGDVFRQIRDLPDGSQVVFKVK